MAATGTPTPNIGLRTPQGTDPASVDDINYNSNLIDTKLGAVGNDSVQDQIDSLNSNLTNLLFMSERISNSVSVADSTFVTLATFTPTVAGYYLFTADCSYGESTSGIRILLVDAIETTTNTQINSVLATGRASLQKTRMFYLTTSNIIFIRAYQTSGSSVSCACTYQWIRLKSV